MNDHVRTFVRWGLWALPVWAALLFVSTLTSQPDPTSDFDAFAEYVTTTAFRLSHIIASIGGAALASIGVVALLLFLQHGPSAGRAVVGVAATIAGNTIIAGIFGVAAFVQPALGRAHEGGLESAVDIYNDVYAGPLFITAGIGLLLFAIGGVVTGIAIAASRRLPRWAGWVYGASVVVFAVSNNLLPAVGWTIASALLIGATVAVALTATRQIGARRR